MDTETALTIALKALAYIAGDSRALDRFLAQTGFDDAALRAQAEDPAFLGGVLDFVLGEEPLLVDFCADAGLDPELPARARAALPGATPDW